MQRTTESIQFEGPGGNPLAARLECPAGESKAFALLAHCFGCSKDIKVVYRLSRTLVEHGIAVLRFDFTGIGESSGEFAETNFTSNVADIVAAADFLRDSHRAPELLIGHSLGGLAMLVAAERVPEARGIATIAAPSDTEHLRDRLVERAPQVDDEGEAEIDLFGKTLRLRRQLLEDLCQQHIAEHLEALDRPLLIFHSVEDEVVGIEHAERLYAAAGQPKSLITLPNADHLLSDAADAAYVGEILAAWVERYVW